MAIKKKRPRDLNKLAFSILEEVVGEDEEQETAEYCEKNPHAVELGRLGGLKGGRARAQKLTPGEREEIAKIAARVRWEKSDS